jgi:hypothetical protein
MYVCFGILALVMAFHVGARYGSTSIVDHTTSGIIAMSENDNFRVLLDNGEAWRFRQDLGVWEPISTWDLPVAASEIKFWDCKAFITFGNEVWFKPAAGTWQNYGAPPPVVSLSATTWGEIKAEFRE